MMQRWMPPWLRLAICGLMLVSGGYLEGCSGGLGPSDAPPYEVDVGVAYEDRGSTLSEDAPTVAPEDVPTVAPEDVRTSTTDAATTPPEPEGPSLDAARRGEGVSSAGAGSGSCPTELRSSRPVPWVSQRIRADLPWSLQMCCGPATITSALAASRRATVATPDDLRNTIDWMDGNIPGWSRNGYNCDVNGTDTAQVVATLRGMANLTARAVVAPWCALLLSLDDNHVVMFVGDTQGDNTSSTFRAGSSHWLILEAVDPRSGVARVVDPGRSLASQGASRAYTEASVRARYEARGTIAVIVDLSTCERQCAGRQCGLDPRCNQSCGDCPTGATCTAAGQCQARCVAGGACSTGNVCEIGTTACADGVARCVRSGYAPAGSPCGAGLVCELGACRAAACVAGTANCDGNAANGCEVSVRVDVNHCGACGRRCSLPNATASCVDAVCRVALCSGASRDCDGNKTNGCETRSDQDVANCGACGNRCALPQASALCSAGRCAIQACAAGAANCDGNPANGCEVLTATDRSNCGACGRACAPSDSCIGGVCTPAPECTGTQTRTCATGLLGVCADGTRTCSGTRFGPCVALSMATDERCDNRLDDNCNGTVDEGCCTSASAPATLTSPSDGRVYTTSSTATLRWDPAPNCERRGARLRIRRCLSRGCTDPARDGTGTLVLDEVQPVGETRASIPLSRFGPGSYRWVVEYGGVAPMYRVYIVE